MAQNGDLIKQAMFEELQKILNPDDEIRKQAEGRLTQLKYTEGNPRYDNDEIQWLIFNTAGYGIYLAEITINQNLDLALRQLASVMLKQYVEDYWATTESDDYDLLVNNEAKIAIKTILPQGLYDPNSKVEFSPYFILHLLTFLFVDSKRCSIFYIQYRFLRLAEWLARAFWHYCEMFEREWKLCPWCYESASWVYFRFGQTNCQCRAHDFIWSS